MSILFIDKNIPDYNLFLKNIKVDFKNDLYHVNNNRIGFVWHNKNSLMPFGKTKYMNSNIFTEEFIHFLSQYNVPVIIDLISCCLKNELFDNEIENIKTLLPNITINYSNNYIGNQPQGSWILDSENIEDIYFNDGISEYKHIFGFPASGALGDNFTDITVDNVMTFTLNTNFTIDNINTWAIIDTTYSNNVDQLIIDCNNKTITIEEDDFNGLFYIGNTFVGNNKPTIIKNLFIKATVNINVAIAKIDGNVRFENCYLELFGNINNTGGGLVNNSTGGSGITIVMTNCSSKVFGKIGSSAGPLIGYISGNSGNVYTITNCSSVVTDNNSLVGNNTLGSSAGAFVGSGISNTANINNSYCLFNGSMGEGAGIIAGKFLGSNGTLTIDKFYAVSNITQANDGSVVGNAPNYSYNLSSYFGGAIPSAFVISNLNILNLGINLTNIYCEVGTLYPTLTNLNKYIDYTNFATTAHTTDAKIGNTEYTITFNPTNIFYSFTNNYINNWDWDLDTDILKGISVLSTFTIDNQAIDSVPFIPTLPTIIVGDGNITYTSSDITKATVDINTCLITIVAIGTVTITATLEGNDYYLLTTRNATFTINNLPCLTYDTKVLTPNGYVLIQDLKNGDLVLTHDKRPVNIVNIFATSVRGTIKTYPYIIPKNGLGKNYPIEEIRISGNHLIKYRNLWVRAIMYRRFKRDMSNKIIKYFHIQLPNYETDNLVINYGTIVESLGPNVQKSFYIYKKRLGLVK